MVSILGAFVGSYVAVVAANHVSIVANKQKFADKLIDSIRMHLDYLQVDSPRHETNWLTIIEDYHNFVSTLWFWEKKSISELWVKYKDLTNSNKKQETLTKIIEIVKKLSG